MRWELRAQALESDSPGWEYTSPIQVGLTFTSYFTSRSLGNAVLNLLGCMRNG